MITQEAAHGGRYFIRRLVQQRVAAREHGRVQVGRVAGAPLVVGAADQEHVLARCDIS